MDITSVALILVSATLLLTLIGQMFAYGHLRREIAGVRAHAAYARSEAAIASARAASTSAARASGCPDRAVTRPEDAIANARVATASEFSSVSAATYGDTCQTPTSICITDAGWAESPRAKA